MKIFIFELNKIWKQRNLMYLLLITILFISGLFFYHYLKQDDYVERERETLELYATEIGSLQHNLRKSSYQLDDELTEHDMKQVTELEQAAAALSSWKVALAEGPAEDIPSLFQSFIIHLNAYEELGDSFDIFPAEERDLAWKKNEWMLRHDYIYVDERYPITSMPLLKSSSLYLLQLPGLFLLLFIFGITITKEKEDRTWATLKTQPIRNRHIYLGKYASLLVMTCFYICFIIIYSIGLPLVFGQDLMLHYPQAITNGDEMIIISSLQYILQLMILFILMALFVFSLAFFVSTFIKQSFTMLAVTSFIIFIGYYASIFNPFLQDGWNPFYIMQFSNLFDQDPQNHFWIYVTSSMVWTMTLLLGSIYFSNKQWQWSTKIFKGKKKRRKVQTGREKLAAQSNLFIIIRFELLKLKRKGLMTKALLLFILLLVFGFFILKTESKEKELNYLASMEDVIDREYSSTLQEEREEFEAWYEDADESTQAVYELYLDSSLEILDIALEQEEKAEQALLAYEKNEWTALYEYQYFINRRTNGEFPSHSSSKDTLSQFTIDVSLLEKQWLIEHNVAPIFGGDEVPTLFLNFHQEKDEKKWLEEQKRVDANGLFSIYFYMNHYFYLLVIIFLLFLLGTGLTAERGKKRNIDFLQTTPLDKASLLLGKALTALCISFLTVIVLFGFTLLTSTLFDRFGDWSYPILSYDHKQIAQARDYSGHRVSGLDTGFHFVPLGEHVLHQLGLFLCLTIFLVTLGIFLSIFIKQQIGLIITTITLAVLGYLFSQYASNIAHLLPFTYFDIPRIINNELAILSDNPSLTTKMGYLVLVGSTSFLLLLGWGIFRMKDGFTTKRKQA